MIWKLCLVYLHTMDYTYGSNEIYILVYIWKLHAYLVSKNRHAIVIFISSYWGQFVWNLVHHLYKEILRSYFYEVYMEEACKHAI